MKGNEVIGEAAINGDADIFSLSSRLRRSAGVSFRRLPEVAAVFIQAESEFAPSIWCTALAERAPS